MNNYFAVLKGFFTLQEWKRNFQTQQTLRNPKGLLLINVAFDSNILFIDGPRCVISNYLIIVKGNTPY
jgi:hypothetical protein